LLAFNSVFNGPTLLMVFIVEADVATPGEFRVHVVCSISYEQTTAPQTENDPWFFDATLYYNETKTHTSLPDIEVR
jgi:hypothetical protein